MTIEQFGQTIKQKYPQYQDLPDADLGQKMLTKYPEYQDMVKADSPATDTFLEGHPVLKGISDLVGTTGLAKGIAQGIFLKFTPEGKNLLGLVSQGQLKQEDVEKVIGKTATTKEILGSAVQTATTIATAGIGAAKAPGVIGKVAETGVKLGGLSALSSGAQAFGEGKSPEEIAKATAISGGVGAVLGGGATLIGKGIGGLGNAITEALPKRLVQSAIGQSKKELMAGKDISEFFLEKGRIGTAEQLIKESQDAVHDLGGQITNLLKSAPKTARILKNEVSSVVAGKINKEGGKIVSKEINDIVGQLAPQAKGLLTKQSLSLPEANQLRQALDKTLGDRGFLTSQLPFNKEVLRSFTNALREKVKTLAPKGNREVFTELSKEITLRDSLIGKYSGQAKNQVVNAFDLILAGGGFLGGGTAGAVASFAIKKALQSAVGKTTLARSLNLLGEKISPILEKLEPAERTIILTLLNDLSSEAVPNNEELTPPQ